MPDDPISLDTLVRTTAFPEPTQDALREQTGVPPIEQSLARNELYRWGMEREKP